MNIQFQKDKRNGMKVQTLQKSHSLPLLINKHKQTIPQCNANVKSNKSIIIKRNKKSPVKKISLPKISKDQRRLNKLYKINNKYIMSMKKLQKDNSIVYNNDFTITKYQTNLLNKGAKNIRYSYLRDLSDDFRALNSNKSKKNSFTSQWQILARKLENIVPKHLLDKLNSLGCRRNGI